MKVAERTALIERIARSDAWLALTDEERESHRDAAVALVDELESSHRDSQEVGWVFLDPEPAEAGG